MGQRLGQHFLVNKRVIGEIIDALAIKAGDLIVEIGSGHGELTFELAKKPIRLMAVEKDEQLAEDLQSRIKNYQLEKVIRIIREDILEELPQISRRLKADSYKVVGNIPYYLTGFLLRLISQLDHKPSLIVFTLQKEVAARIAAQPPQMNLLAASVQYWAEPKIMALVPASDFKPKPKVDSAIIRLKIKENGLGKEEKNYYQLIKMLFRQPRKTILNNLAVGLGKDKERIKEKLTSLGLNEKARPQNLTLETIKQIASSF